MELVSTFWIGYFLLVTTVFGTSSILLYGSIFGSLREWWLKNTGPLGDLLQCQLCISVWIALALQWFILGWPGTFMYFFVACSVAGISWLLGAFTQANLWKKACYEKWYGKGKNNVE